MCSVAVPAGAPIGMTQTREAPETVQRSEAGPTSTVIGLAEFIDICSNSVLGDTNFALRALTTLDFVKVGMRIDTEPLINPDLPVGALVGLETVVVRIVGEMDPEPEHAERINHVEIKATVVAFFIIWKPRKNACDGLKFVGFVHGSFAAGLKKGDRGYKR